MSIKQKFMIILSVFVVISVLDAVYIVNYIEKLVKIGKLVNVSGRQRMLSQKMTKEAFQIANNIDVESNVKNLSNTKALFESSLMNMIKGNEKEGILPPPNKEIKKQLQVGLEHWKEFKINIEIILQNKNNKQFNDALQYVYNNNIKLLKEMNEAVSLYEKASDVRTIQIFKLIIVSFIIIVALLLLLYLNNFLIKSILHFMNKISDSSEELDNDSNTLLSSSQTLANGASELASTVEEITASIGEFQSMIETNTKNVNEASKLMDNSLKSAEKTSQHMEEMKKAMNDIRDGSNQINKVITVIDDIAFQTNILALNASVEAARAGEAGAGFAIVADQVKDLAQKSSNAASETARLIEKAVERIEYGENLEKTLSQSQYEAVEQTNKVGSILTEVNNRSQEQLKGTKEITQAINQINAVVQQTANNSESASSQSQKLLKQAEQLSIVVEKLNEIITGKQSSGKRKNQSKNYLALPKQNFK